MMLAPLPAFVVALFLTAAVSAYLVSRDRAGRPVDPDAGGYTDSWTTVATFPDKVVHFALALALTGLYWRVGVPAALAWVLTVALGVVWERTNVYFSRYDVAANALGAAVAALALGSLPWGPGFL